VIDEIRRLSVEHNVYRGQVIAFGSDVFGHGITFLSFVDRSEVRRDQVILPAERVTDAHLSAALDQLLDTRNQLTRVLLGAQQEPGE